MIFRALRKYSKDPNVSKTFCSAGKFFKKLAKNDALRIFEIYLIKNLRFFSARSPLKFSYIGAKGALLQLFDVDQPKMDLAKLYQKGGEPLEKIGNKN